MARRPSQSPGKPLHSLPPRLLSVGRQYHVGRDGRSRIATVLDVRLDRHGLQEAYVNFVGDDKRLDRWIPSSDAGEEVLVDGQPEAGPSKKRKINVVRATPEPAPSSSAARSRNGTPSAQSTPEREHASMTRVRNFEDVRFGEYLIKTWYYSPYPLTDDAVNSSHVPNGKHPLHRSNSGSFTAREHHAKEKGRPCAPSHSAHLPNGHSAPHPSTTHGLLGSRGRLFVCDLCFKYSLSLSSWQRHSSACSLLLPPGRKVYQRGSYTIWEIDGAQEPLYCQNLSLFGKLFIDHKSVFFHVEGFLFYVLCDAATSRRDQVMAFFSKEKLSYDDFNLACIVTFPPFQGRAFGKLLIEFSYLLTRHPSTRPATLSPGTPERPLSDLGLKGYTVYWVSVILRFLAQLLEEAEPFDPGVTKTPQKGRIARGSMGLRRRSSGADMNGYSDAAKDEDLQVKQSEPYHGQYSISFTLAGLAKSCHLRVDDATYALGELGFLRRQRPVTESHGDVAMDEAEDAQRVDKERTDGEWSGKEVVVTRDQVQDAWGKWKVRAHGVLEEKFLLL